MVRRRKCLLWLILLSFAGLVGALSLRPGVYLPHHQHCIRAGAIELHGYAASHAGRFPEDPNGYGNALLMLDENTWPCLTGPGYDAAAFREAKATGRGLSEELCGRVYVQGLSMKNNPRLAILFDKLATPGGDHCFLPIRLWAARGREVAFVDGRVEFVADENWPDFAAEQVDLLVNEGIPRAEAERLYVQALGN